LETAPDDGEYRVWWGSDQRGGTLTITSSGELVLETSESPVLARAGALDLGAAPDAKWLVEKGDVQTIAYVENSAATEFTLAVRFLDRADLMIEQGFAYSDIDAELGVE